MELVEIVGWTASITMVCGYLPQTVKTIRTRSTDDIAVGTFLLMAIGGLCFMIQGFMLHNYPLACTNLLTTSMSSIIFGIKIYNDAHKRRKPNS